MIISRLILFIFFLNLSIPAYAQISDSSIVAKFERHSFAQDTTALNYRLFKPAVTDDSKNYPLILTLHGAGERGHDNEKHIAWHGIATAWADTAAQKRNPCFILSPQCPEDNRWVDADWKPGMYDQDTVQMSNELQAVHQLIQNLVAKYPIDTNRLYITGLSMGAQGAWDYITRYPDLFAAAIIMSAGGDPNKMDKIKHMPLWTFHGDMDKAVSVNGMRATVEALKQYGSDVIYTEIAEGNHVIWKPLYENRLLQDWLFSKSKK
jgi:predicted peptidase